MTSTSGEIKRVALVGAGVMGVGIVDVVAMAGFDVVWLRGSDRPPAEALARLTADHTKRVARGKLADDAAQAARARIAPSADVAAVATCDLVIETIAEDLAQKRALLARLAAHAAPHAIFASNTSTLKIDELARGIRPTRMAALHFFSPVPAMALVEVATLAATDADVAPALLAFVHALGKTPVPVADATGFIVNRLLVPYLLSAMVALQSGLASAPQIDTAMRLGCGHPLGPLALADLIGLDIVASMADLLHAEFKHPSYEAPAVLRALVAAGLLGRKSGGGFYVGDAPNPRLAELLAAAR